MVTKKKFYLLPAQNSPERNLPLFRNKNTWFYIGTDYNTFSQWRKVLATAGTYVSLSSAIEEYGLRFRKGFLDYIAGMSAKNNSLAWWMTSLADKDPSESDFYLSICLLAYFNETMSTLADGSVLIAENSFFLDSFAVLAGRHGNRCVYRYRGEKIRAYFKLYYRLFGRAIKFLFQSAYELWTARKAGDTFPTGGKEQEQAVIIRTWVKDTCFRKDGSFEDIYFGGLAAWLQKAGYTVWIIPENMRLSQPLISIFEYYKKHKHYRFLLTEDFLRFSDYVRCLTVGLKGTVSLKIATEFQGMELSSLLAGERLRYGLHGLKMIRYFYFCRRLRDAGINPRHVIMTFENKFMEKAFILGLKHYLPGTISVGYQHCAHYPLILNFFTCEREIPYLPLPDAIVTCGDAFSGILEMESFSKERIIPGPALRFEYLFQEQERKDVPAGGQRKTILVILPADLRSVMEITLNIRAALYDSENTDVLLKVHPSQHAAISSMLLSLDMPKHFMTAIEPISSLVLRTDVAISVGATTAEFEIINAGVPLVRLRRELGFTFSPWIEGYEQTTPAEELREKIHLLLQLSLEEKETLKRKGLEIIQKYFAPVTEESMRQFVSFDSRISSS